MSSVRSFWPLLSIVKGCLFLFVIFLVELLCSTFPPAAVLRATYYGTVTIFISAILIGLLLPGLYPLTVLESGRHRLALFAYTHGDFAYMTGLSVFVGRLPAVRAPWYFQLFLAALTIASGSRACAIALLVIWAALQLFRARDFRLKLGISVLSGAAVTMLLLLTTSGAWSLGTSVHGSLQEFYGARALEQSPWQLSGRVQLWEAAAGTFGKSILLGFGFDGARDQLLRSMPWAGGAHNAFLQLLLTAGGAGLMCFLAGWIFAIRSNFKRRAGRSALAVHCFLLMVAIAGPSFTMNQCFGVFLVLCLRNWSRSMDVNGSKTFLLRGSLMNTTPRRNV